MENINIVVARIVWKFCIILIENRKSILFPYEFKLHRWKRSRSMYIVGIL